MLIRHLWHYFFVAILSQSCRQISQFVSRLVFLNALNAFFVFAVDHLIPRMRECLEGTSVPQRSDAPTGRELIKLYATDYFTKMSEVSYFELLKRSREASVHSIMHPWWLKFLSVETVQVTGWLCSLCLRLLLVFFYLSFYFFLFEFSQEAGIEPSRRILWVDQEVDNFLAGPAVPAFASLCMSLGPFVVAVEEGGPTHVQTFTNMFEWDRHLKQQHFMSRCMRSSSAATVLLCVFVAGCMCVSSVAAVLVCFFISWFCFERLFLLGFCSARADL